MTHDQGRGREARSDDHHGDGDRDDGAAGRALSRSLSLDDFVAWLTSHGLGESGGDWLRDVIKQNEITSSQDLMALLAIKWPRLIMSEGREKAVAWVSNVVCEDFLLEASPRLFPSLVYQTLLDRQPTPAEAKKAAEAAEADGDRLAFVQQLSKSEEYRRSSHRRALLRDGPETQSVFETRRDDYLSVGYRIPDAVPDHFFDLGNDMEEADRVPLKGFVCARYDSTYNRLITDPNVSVIGVGIGGNRFRVKRDWLVLGPRVTLSPGDYTIVVDVAFESDTEATVDLVSSYGTKQHLSLTFNESLKSIIPVRIDETTHAVELRIINLNNDSDVMQLNELGIYVRPEGRHKPASAVVSGLPPATTTHAARDVGKKPAAAASSGLARLFGLGAPKDAMKATQKFVAATKEFDGGWYAREYPDVAGAGWDPLKHFLVHGMREGRLPNDSFDPIGFAGSHPQYARSDSIFVEYLKERHPALAKKYL